MQTYIHLLILRCKMLVGKSQTLELHPTDAGYAFLQNALLGLRRSAMLKQQERSLLQDPALVAAVKQKMKMKEYLSFKTADGLSL